MEFIMKDLVRACVAELGAAVDRFPWERRSAYADWLAQTYYYVRHTTRLLAAAAARFAMDEKGDALHKRFCTHLAEEHGHELLVVQDLKHLGALLSQFPEHSSTKLFYESQYYKIEHVHPIVHFGYILPLEALGPACGTTAIDRVATAHGGQCTSFLRLHSQEDVDHLRKALEMIATVTEEHRDAIGTNVKQTTYGYQAILLEITNRLAASPIAC
jgi:hypothetical protein